jgi:hypothetical protein
MLMKWIAELQRRNAEHMLKAEGEYEMMRQATAVPSWLGYVCPCCGQIATPPSLLSALGMWSR